LGGQGGVDGGGLGREVKCRRNEQTYRGENISKCSHRMFDTSV
jgi:hypothetical protein